MINKEQARRNYLSYIGDTEKMHSLLKDIDSQSKIGNSKLKIGNKVRYIELELEEVEYLLHHGFIVKGSINSDSGKSYYTISWLN